MTDWEKLARLPEPMRTQMTALYERRPQEFDDKNYEKGVWYRLTPPNLICSDGDTYHGTIKIGKENKLIICFCGGGAALDDYMAARPDLAGGDKSHPGFYASNVFIIGDFLPRKGIYNKDDERNPFRDWSVLIIPYGTADFHCGTNDYTWHDKELGEGVIHHHGYLNVTALLKKTSSVLPSPEALLITGYSAGGFGTSILADTVMDFFTDCQDVTAFVDSAFLLYEGWKTTAEKQWKAPAQICDNILSDNIVLDCLTALKKKRGNKIKIAFGCSVRDALLSQNQNYINKDTFVFSLYGGKNFQKLLSKHVNDLRVAIPDIALLIFDNPSTEVKDLGLTEHCFSYTDLIYDIEQDGVRAIDWIWTAVNGNPKHIGLGLLEK